MQEQSRPDRLVEYFCTVGLSSPLVPLYKDGISPSSPLHGLCLAYNKDEPPAHYSKLELCYYGGSANLNAGNPNFLSPSVFLCLSRSPHCPPLSPDDDPSRPITDVIVVYPDRNERPPPGYITAQVVGGGGGRSSPYGKALVIAYSREGKRPLLDLVLCEATGGGGGVQGPQSPVSVPPAASLLPSVSAPVPTSPLSPPLPCQVPPHYVVLKKAVSMGAFHSATFLAVLPSPASLSSLLLRPQLLDRHPRVDLPSSPLPESLPYFAFPEGALILPHSSPPPSPSVSTFVLTQPSGLLLYCAALTFYEACSVTMDRSATVATAVGRSRRLSTTGPALTSTTSPSPDLLLPADCGLDVASSERGWAPKCLVLVSYYAYYRAFAQWLQRVYGLSVSGCPCPVERLVVNLWETPLPRPSHQSVQLRLPTVYAAASASPSVAFTATPISFPRPPPSSLPLCDFSFLPLFQRLSLNNVLMVLTAMLNEKKIVVYSSTPSVLTPLCQALVALLFPLQWTSPFVPVVPALSSGILDAPMPVLVGVDGRYALHRLSSVDDACVVDVDGDEVRVHGKYGPISEPLTSQLRKELAAFAGVEQGREVREGEFEEVACRACFLHFFVALLGEVDDALLFPPISADREPSFEQLFNLQAFLAAPHRKVHKPLLRGLCSTQLFSHFIEEKTYSASADRRLDLLFFDECVRYEAEHRAARAQKAQHVPLITRVMQQRDDVGYYLVPTPDVSDLLSPSPSTSASPTPALSIHRYPAWPKLDPARMGRPRPVDLKYLREALNEQRTAAVAKKGGQGGPLAQGGGGGVGGGPLTSPRGRLQAALAVAAPSSPLVYAKGHLRDVYAVWFELRSICLPVHPSPHAALLRVWTGLARMTAQGVDPDVGIYRSVLSICGRWRKKEEASLIFDTMRRQGIKPSSLTYGAYTSALAESFNEAELERERTREKETATADAAPHINGIIPGGDVAALQPSAQHEGAAPSVDGAPAAAVVSSAPLPSPPRGLYLDPFRLAYDKHKRLILRAHRQRVVWSQLTVSVTHTCSACRYELSEGEVLTSWHLSPQPSCPQCQQTFAPHLSVLTPIVTHPPRLKLLVFRHLLRRPLLPVHRRYHISVPLLSAPALRQRFMSAAVMFKEDLLNVNVMRVMHHVVYWNVVYALSQPYNAWDLTFLDDSDLRSGAGDEERRKTRIRRHRKGAEEEEGSDFMRPLDPAAAASAAASQPRGRRLPQPFRLDEGLRERSQGAEGQAASPVDAALLRSVRGTEEEGEDGVGPILPHSRSTSMPNSPPFSAPESGANSLTSTSTSTALLPLPSLSSSLSIDTDLSASSASLSSLSLASVHPPPAASTASTSAYTCLTMHAADWPVEREMCVHLVARAFQPAMELFLRHRMRSRAERAFSGANATDSSLPVTPRTRLRLPPPEEEGELSPALSPASSSKQLLVKRGGKSAPRSPRLGGSSSVTSSPNLTFTSTPAVAPPSFPSPISPSAVSSLTVSSRSPSQLAKSRSSNEVESLRSTFASVTSLALTALKTGRHDLSPHANTPSQRPLPPSSSSDSALPLAVWYPMRDAGPSVPLYLHSMFEVLLALGLKYWESYERFCDDYDRAVEEVVKGFADEVTAMDRAPRPEVRLVEVVLGLRKDKEKAKRERRERARKAAAAAKAEESDGLQKVAPPIVKSASMAVKPAANAHPASSPRRSPQPPAANGAGVVPTLQPLPPIAVSFPIAYPVTVSVSTSELHFSSAPAVLTSPPASGGAGLLSPTTPMTPATPITPSSSRSPVSPTFPATPPAPSTPKVPSTPSTQYETEVYSGPLSQFIAGTPNSRHSPMGSEGALDRSREEGEGDEEEGKGEEADEESSDVVDIPQPLNVRQTSAGRTSRRSLSSAAGVAGAGDSGGSKSPTPPSPPQPQPPSTSPPPPASSSSAQHSRRPLSDELRVSRSRSQPDHAGLHLPQPHSNGPPASAHPSHATRPALSTTRSTSSMQGAGAAQGASAGQQPRSLSQLTQSLYHFIMTKPTGASSAGSGVTSSGSGSGGGGTLQPSRGRIGGGATGGKRVLSSSSVESGSKRREEREKEKGKERDPASR